MDYLIQGYEQLMSKRDARVEGWLLMSSPFPTLFAVLLYLVVVTQGPKLMQRYKPFDLKELLIVYNFGLVVLSVYMAYEFIVSSWTAPNFNIVCATVDYSNNEHAVRLLDVIWWYYFSKIIELLDTCFFVLRKKNNQISFLHVFHHSTMPLLWWIGTKFVGGGESFFSATLNSCIHILMYSYYMLAAMGPAMQPYLWWKKYITSLQLTQFGLVLIKTTSAIYIDCGFPVAYGYALVAYMLVLISFFSNFYYQTYLKKAQGKGKVPVVANGKGSEESDNENTEMRNGFATTRAQSRKMKRLD